MIDSVISHRKEMIDEIDEIHQQLINTTFKGKRANVHIKCVKI